MIMDVGGNKKVANPTDEQIRAALESFDAKKVKEGEAFVVLGPDGMNYMQASGERKGGFDLEYQERDTEHHYRATKGDFSLEELVAILSAYRAGTPNWKSMAEWEGISI